MTILAITGFKLLTLLSVDFVPPDTTKVDSRQMYLKTQFAGNDGLLSVGAGYEYSNSNFSIDLNYGYLPKLINGRRVITLSMKPAFHFKEFTFTHFQAGAYFGASVTYSITQNVFAKMPSYYPYDYYWPNAFHLNPFLGARINIKTPDPGSKRIYFFSEIGTVEYKIWYALKNKTINMFEIWSLSFGMILRLGNN